MTKQYWVDEFYVDLSRNQISQPGTSQTLPPKALAVLTYLAQQRGRVVSYEELLDAVWPNAVVTPNTLQRSIAQLRKALGENSKAQNIIKTHAKQGYSLECDVRWQEQDPVSPDITQEIVDEPQSVDVLPAGAVPLHDKKAKIQFTKTRGLVAISLILLIAALIFQEPEKHLDVQIRDIHYLTATDAKEFGPNYSPDGEYILFHRYPEKLCINHIWAKNIRTQEEFQLTKDLGTYGNYSLSQDGEKLVFVQQEDCTQPVEQQHCYHLMQIDFKAALQQPQNPTELLRCENSTITRPIWFDDGQIAMMQREAERWRLIRYLPENGSTTDLYRIPGGNIVNYAWSHQYQRFAVSSMKEDGQHYLDMLDATGALVSSHPVQFPDDAPRHLFIYPRFVPDKALLIFGDGSKLYTMTFDGQVQTTDLRLDGNFGGPKLHPNGKRMLVIKGRYDSDLARMTIPENNANYASTLPAGFRPFERSNYQEDLARFQPNGNIIAFTSERTGRDQVWLTDGTSPRMLSDFPKGKFIRQLHWNHSGSSLLAQANGELHQLFLDKPGHTFSFDYPVFSLFHWDDATQTVIANIVLNGIIRFAQIDLVTGQYQLLNEKKIYWAATSANSPLIYQDHLNRLWQADPLEDKLLSPLSGKLGTKQRFLVRNNVIYGVNEARQLWSFDLSTAEYQINMQMTSDTDYLTDIEGDEILFTFVVAAKKEVIEVEFED